MAFTSLEHRLAQGYMDMLPSFVPDENAAINVPEQEDFYALIKGMFKLASDEPLYFVTSLHEDDAFPSRCKKAYGKPKLIGDMKKFTKSIEGLLQAMFLLGQGKEVKLNKKQMTILSKLGIKDLTNLPAAWKWMSTKNGANISTFSHCLFNDQYPYTSEIYARLLGESSFKKLENWMLSQGYKRHDIYNIIASDCNLSLTITNPAWNDEPPRGGFEYKIKHTGIAAQFDFYVKDPPILGLCIPNGMKPYLESFNSMDSTLKAFIVSRTKKCNMCRYCVQTDKTDSRLLAYTGINYKGQEYQLCNYFPGYNYCWKKLDDDLVDMLIKMLTFMDKFMPLVDKNH